MYNKPNERNIRIMKIETKNALLKLLSEKQANYIGTADELIDAISAIFYVNEDQQTDKEIINSFFSITLSHFPGDLPTSNNLDKNISDLKARLQAIKNDYSSDYECGECDSPESCKRHQTCNKERA